MKIPIINKDLPRPRGARFISMLTLIALMLVLTIPVAEAAAVTAEINAYPHAVTLTTPWRINRALSMWTT